MSLTICAEYFVIDWNFSYIEDTSCIHGLSSDFQIVLSNSIYVSPDIPVLVYIKDELQKKLYTNLVSEFSTCFNACHFQTCMNYPKKQFTVYKQKKTCILYICKQNLYVCDHTFILSYIWCTWLIYWEFSAISIMYFNINIIFHINQVFDLKKKFKITQKYFPIYFSLTLCWHWFCV